MMAGRLRRPRRPNMRRAVILFPSGLTLFNLFFGIFAIITAARGDFHKAGIFVLLGGICDALDGRVARATNAGSQFGEELDSLVDAISFLIPPSNLQAFREGTPLCPSEYLRSLGMFELPHVEAPSASGFHASLPPGFARPFRAEERW